MITVADFKDWMKQELPEVQTWSVGAFRQRLERQVILFGAPALVNPTGVGTRSSYRGLGVRLLVHGTKNVTESERLANAVYAVLAERPAVTIKGTRIAAWQFREPGPVFLGADADGVFQFAISLELILGGI